MGASAFDSRAFAANVLADLRVALTSFEHEAASAVQVARHETELLQQDLGDTLAAIAATAEPRARSELETSLRSVLPARTSSILSALVSEISTESQAALEAILQMVEKAALIAVKSFVPIP